jgi:hypothetical protein
VGVADAADVAGVGVRRRAIGDDMAAVTTRVTRSVRTAADVARAEAPRMREV